MGDQPPDLASESPDSPKLLAALALAEAWGVRIALAHWITAGLCSCFNAECPNPGKHPLGGAGWKERATSDPIAIRARLDEFPLANIGILTGRASGVVVLDVDGAEGDATLAKYPPLPAAPMVITARGWHVYFAAGDVPLRNRVGEGGRGFGPGLDFRGEGGFAVIPPSIHESGHVYSWHAGSGYQVPLPMPTEWIVEHTCDRVAAMPSAQLSLVPAAGGARADRWARGALESEIQTVRTTAEGGRNRALNDAAFNLGMLVAGDRLDAGDVKRSLLAAAMEAGLPELEAQKTIRSGFAAGYQKDRRSGPTRELTKPGYTNGAHTTVVESWEPPGPPAETGPAAAQPTAAEPPSAMIPRYHTAQLFAPLPPQRWCVPGLQIGPGRPTLLVGFGASAKTIAVQSLALCLATGRPVWGHFDSAPMSVLHIDYEQGLYATAKRYQRLAIGHGIDPAELEGRIEYVEMPRVYLDKKGAESEYRRACAGFDLVIVDALRGAAPFSDENDSSFRSAIDVLTFVSQCEQCSMLVLHHASKPRKDNAGAPGGGGDARTLARGSSAIYDASGCVLNFVAQPDGSKLVRQVKMPAEAEGMELEACACAGASPCRSMSRPRRPKPSSETPAEYSKRYGSTRPAAARTKSWRAAVWGVTARWMCFGRWPMKVGWSS
jgi:hypothetical protein